MCNRLFLTLLILCICSFEALAIKGDNPFAKNKSLSIGKEVSWVLDKQAVVATKSMSDGEGSYFHLRFNNTALTLLVSSDAAGKSPKSFTQLEVKDILIDGKQAPLFKWCLKNQQRHNRFLQQGLKVKNGICTISGKAGSFVLRLNRATLTSLQQGSRLKITLKPFRTPLDLNYDISDFNDMSLALNAKAKPASAVSTIPGKTNAIKKCWAGPPAKYRNIKSVEYRCDDAVEKKDAEAWVVKLVSTEKAKEQKIAARKAADKERQRKSAEEKKQKALAEQQQQEQVLQVEAAALAASQAKQAQIGGEITQKMVSMCDKYWSKGEHRCYCQKYIEHAPSDIQAKSTCE